jgi:hypothetical protein
MPDYVLAKPPTVSLKSEGDAPWDAYKVFGFDHVCGVLCSPDSLKRHPAGSSVCSMVPVVSSSRRVPVAIAKIQPKRPIITQNPPNLTEYIHHSGRVSLWRVF